MAFKAMADNNVAIPVRYDASLYNIFADGTDFIFKGIDNELKITYGSGTLRVTLGTGGCIIDGRHVFNDAEGTVSLQLNANDSGYLVIRYDLTQSAGNEASFMAVSSIETGDLNNTGTKKDLLLAQYKTDSTGVTSFIDLRVYESMKTNVKLITLSTSWVYDSTNAYYTQSVDITGIKATDTPTLDVKTSGTATNIQTQQKEWSKVLQAITYDGGITFYAKSATTSAITIMIKPDMSKVTINNVSSEEAGLDKLDERISNCFSLDGSAYRANAGANLDEFKAGTIIVTGNSTAPTTDWWLIVSGANDAGTVTQVAFSLFNNISAKHRYCTGGTWNAWANLKVG